MPAEGNLLFNVNVTSINGTGDSDPSNNIAEAYMLSLAKDKGFARNVLVEEGTGTWCGNCPRGAVGMKRMTEKYPDNFIGIAAHLNDRMEIESYMPFLAKYIDPFGYPYCTIDRVISDDPGFDVLEANFKKEADVPAITEISIKDIKRNGSMLTVTPEARFAVDENNASYGWAFMVTEDHVGPYMQTNYYTDGSLEGWDETEAEVRMYFDEVAVAGEYIMGSSDVLPAAISASESYSLPMTINCSKVKNWENAHIIAAIINLKSGYVENAVRKSLNQTGVGAVAAEQSAVTVDNGIISLTAGEHADVYNVAGARVASLTNGQRTNVGSGIYIVVADGKSTKVIVR